MLAEENDFWLSDDKDREEVRKRVLVEEKALDSFSNLLYSMILFWRTTKKWPEKITIISHEFKKTRFLNHHVPTLGIPVERVGFVGINPLYMDSAHESHDKERSEEVMRGEEKRGLRAWMEDEWGRGEVLRGKRAGRNFWGVEQVLFESEEERGRSGLRLEIVRFEYEGREVVEEVLVEGFDKIYIDMLS